MDFFSVPHLLVILLLVVILFGAGKLPRVMGDFAKGIKAFKAGMREDEEAAAAPPAPVAPPAASAPTTGPTAADHPHEHA
jgi:sec-independent protein translocase protein TatA